MAAVRAHHHVAAKPWLYSSGKENRPPCVDKRKTSIAGLFEDIDAKRWKSNDRKGHALTAPELGPEAQGQFDKFAARLGKGASEAFNGFEETSESYIHEMKAAQDAKLREVHEELEARANGFDVHGRPIARPGLPSEADLAKLEAERLGLSKPLGEEELDVHVPKAGGGEVIHRLTLSSVLETYNKHSAKKDAVIERLQQELKAVESDLAAGYEDLDDENDTDLVVAKERFDADMAKYKRNILASKEKLEAEYEQAAAEDRAATADFNKKVENLLKGILV